MRKEIELAAKNYTEAMLKRISASHLKEEAELAERTARQLEIGAWQELQALREEALEPRVQTI